MGILDWPNYCSIFYHIREGYYGTALSICDKLIAKDENNHQLRLFKSIANIKLGEYPGALRIVEESANDSGCKLAMINMAKAAHSSEKHSDRNKIRIIEQEIVAMLVDSDEENYFNATVACLLFRIDDKIMRYQQRVLARDAQKICIQGWIDLSINSDVKSAIGCFEKAIASGYPDAFIGKAHCLKSEQDPDAMKQVLNDLTIHYPTFVPGYLELANAFLALNDWTNAIEAAQKATVIEDDCVAAHIIQLIYAIVIQTDKEHISINLRDLCSALEKNESENHYIYYKLAKTLGRVIDDGSIHADYARNFIDRALHIARKPEYLAESSLRLIQFDDVKSAKKLAAEALQCDSNHEPELLLGIVRCFIAEGEIEDAQAQLEFVRVTHPEASHSALFLYLSAVVDRKCDKPLEHVLGRLKKAADIHLNLLQGLLFGIDYLYLLDPKFLIEVVIQLYNYAPLTMSESNRIPAGFPLRKVFQPTNIVDDTLREINRILSIIHSYCPGLMNVTYLLAKAKYLSMDIKNAEYFLKMCIDNDETIPEAYLLMAQVQVWKKNYNDASKFLNIGLSVNFKVRDHPIYHLIKAKLQKQSKQFEDSIETLRQATQLPAFKNTYINSNRDKLDVTDTDRISIYLELIDSMRIHGDMDEADMVLEEAKCRCTGKAEEEQLVLMEADLKLKRKDIDGALKLLSAVSPFQANYQTARIKMAQIYLGEKKDKSKFASCYRQIIKHNPSPFAYVLLGNAYMSIQEPTKAIEMYETALKINPKDDELVEKTGQAYIQCHMYNKAVCYYEAALKRGHKSAMRKRLVELLLRLGNYEKCEKVLRTGLDANATNHAVVSMSDQVSYYMLLSKVHYGKGNWSEATEDLIQAKDIQKLLIDKLQAEASNHAEEKTLVARIFCQLAEIYWNRRDGNKAVEFYTEAIILNGNDIKTMLSLASIYFSMNKFEECSAQCQSILSIDKHNDGAILLIANLLYRSNKVEEAILHFTQLLDRNPNQYHALIRCIELYWRRGSIEEGENYLKAAAEANPRATFDAGYNYCKGMYEWYMENHNAALHSFNRSRRDLEWGERAIYNIIEICLNPENAIIADDIVENERNEQSERELCTKTAERFLQELRFKPDLDYKYRLIENFIMLARNERNAAQQALDNFLEMAGAENEEFQNIGAVYGCAKAYIALKMNWKAKMQLKSVVDHTWTVENADYLEKCWVLLIDLYIKQGKDDHAMLILRNVLKYNVSLVKVHEYFGYIMEREQRWHEAANKYNDAWKLTGMKNAYIGYKLAHSYLKCRKLIKCIDVCHQVLRLDPNYSVIKRNILDKARSMLRT